ncbi:hypothetical protein AGOR_G00047680 [Albula goreensis]|uniref:Uncharacterized protein n=1 Tax=Albula goreensis TaxID=1534307 RepID=A0A8T3DTM9_9TELE|nr:hypothetical protein AGOR_G00047680 [Albula goreensis]
MLEQVITGEQVGSEVGGTRFARTVVVWLTAAEGLVLTESDTERECRDECMNSCRCAPPRRSPMVNPNTPSQNPSDTPSTPRLAPVIVRSVVDGLRSAPHNTVHPDTRKLEGGSVFLSNWKVEENSRAEERGNVFFPCGSGDSQVI